MYATFQNIKIDCDVLKIMALLSQRSEIEKYINGKHWMKAKDVSVVVKKSTYRIAISQDKSLTQQPQLWQTSQAVKTPTHIRKMYIKVH